MFRDVIVPVSVAALVVLAGCGGLGGTGGSGDGSGTGQLNFYISDQQNAIDQFEHLNATVTKVGVHRSNATGDNASAGWIEHDVNNVTVDLTQLQGSKAKLLSQFGVPSGDYNKVFVHVSEVNGTLKDGSSASVKLPSNRLQMNKNFTVGTDQTVDFVFDVSVVKAGQSGGYVLKPVVSESGAGKPITEPAPPQKPARLNFYISDQQNAIDRFEYLNATVTKVGVHRSNATDGNASAGWIERDVNNVTVDLTQLQGSKATRLTQFDVPNGTYTKVFVYVSEVDGKLKDGGTTAVKLPSDRLQLNKNFRVGAGEELDFVFDVSVVEAGKSGKFVLKPVVSESGTEKNITEVDATPGKERTRLTLGLAGNVTPGENVTVSVMQDGSPVENATVYVDDAEVGQTNADGELTLTVPDTNRLTVRVEADGAEARLTRGIEKRRGPGTETPTPTTTAA